MLRIKLGSGQGCAHLGESQVRFRISQVFRCIDQHCLLQGSLYFCDTNVEWENTQELAAPQASCSLCLVITLGSQVQAGKGLLAAQNTAKRHGTLTFGVHFGTSSTLGELVVQNVLCGVLPNYGFCFILLCFVLGVCLLSDPEKSLPFGVFNLSQARTVVVWAPCCTTNVFFWELRWVSCFCVRMSEPSASHSTLASVPLCSIESASVMVTKYSHQSPRNASWLSTHLLSQKQLARYSAFFHPNIAWLHYIHSFIWFV